MAGQSRISRPSGRRGTQPASAGVEIFSMLPFLPVFTISYYRVIDRRASSKEDDMSALNRIVGDYLEGWNRKDASAFAAVLAPDVRFKGPLAQTEGRDAFLAAV